jgi:hypothetical protein
MSISYVAKSEASSNSAQLITISTPNGLEDYDLMLAVIAVDRPGLDVEFTMTVPSGWTLLYSAKDAGVSPMRHDVYYKRYFAGEEANHTWSFSESACPICGAIAAYRGVVTDGVPAESIEYQVDDSGGGDSININVLPTKPNAVAVSTVSVGVNGNAGVAFTGMTERLDFANAGVTLRLALADMYVITPASTLLAASIAPDSGAKACVVFALIAAPEWVDNYKAKLMRRILPPPYDNRLSSQIGKLVSAIGTSDNEIGGLFGAADFLPDEEL